MSKVEKSEFVTINDKEYFAVDAFDDKGNSYVYLVRDGDKIESLICRQFIEANSLILETVCDKEEIKSVIETLAKRLAEVS